MAFKSSYDSDDADDEHERSFRYSQSPTIPPDDYDAASTDSGPMSAEHTPTTFTHSRDSKGSPMGLITEWTKEQVADFIADLKLEQYANAMIEDRVTGEALIALQHAELKDLGVNSVGHRLTILKAVYDMKVKQNIPMEPDDYIPLSADTSAQDAPPTQDDFAKIIRVVQARDERISSAEFELRNLKDELNKVLEENRKFRDEFKSLVRMLKDSQHPLPTPQELNLTSPPAASEKAGSGLSRKFSTKKFFLGAAPKNLSPTIPEGRTLVDSSSLDPSAAALAASSHLTASINGGQQMSPNSAAQPSPTSPAYTVGRPYNSRERGGQFDNENAQSYSANNWQSDTNNANRNNRDPRNGPRQTRSDEQTTANYDGTINTQVPTPTSAPSNPQVEIFKSFRVSIDDPCHKVLPVALKKYNITADWRQYALYIVHGDQERCLGLNERPLILFKQLDKEGRKPMFMLRKHAAPAEGHVSTVGGGEIRSVGPGNTGFGWDGRQVPGGVL